MNILLMTPRYFPKMSGNATTVHRLRMGVEQAGHGMTILDVSTLAPDSRIDVSLKRQHVIHCYHAYKSGRYLLPFLDEIDAPLVLTMPGTDVYVDLHDPDRRSIVKRIVEKASVIMLSHQDMLAELITHVPQAASRCVLVPKGVLLQFHPYPLRSRLSIPEEAPVIYFPASIRHVKNNVYPIDLLAKIRDRSMPFHLVFSGEVLEEGYAEGVRKKAKPYDWIHFAGVIPLESMGCVYEQSDLVLNCSFHEGASNTMMEAMYAGRCVLASDIPGNRALINHEVTGYLYADDQAFTASVRRRIQDEEIRRKTGERASNKIKTHFATEDELAIVLSVYQRVVL